LTYLEAVKRLAAKAGFDEAEYKAVVLAIVTEHGSKEEIAQAEEWAIDATTNKDAAFNKSVDAEIARRAASKKSSKKKAA